jgi:phosphoribosylanthranilate isomerase
MGDALTLPRRTRIKICGLTREQDVRAAVELGADALGFVCFAGSARYVPPERLAALAAAAGPLVTPVLLFVDATAAEIRRALGAVPQALLQFHGAETPQDCAAHGRPYVRAVAMAEGVDLLEFESRFAGAAGILADAPAPAAGAPMHVGPPGAAGFGGAGRTFPWERLAQPQERRLPLILAGGLQADNVGAAIARVRPYAVDVSSGVEVTRGMKDVERMRSFVAAVRAADSQADTRFDDLHGGAA